tara:strand:+ start:78 stop:596 length:519 start_codon:yes stop_codon:yes gene_type:complete
MNILSNILLIAIIVSYNTPIKKVVENYNDSYSISEIITKDDYKYDIAYGFMYMSFFTLLYEYLRNDRNSIGIILLLLIGIFGVIFTTEYKYCIFCMHSLFATISFGSIVSYMIYHIKKRKSNLLNFFLAIQFLILVLCLYNLKSKIFFYESLFLLIFSLTYLYLHYLDFIKL